MLEQISRQSQAVVSIHHGDVESTIKKESLQPIHHLNDITSNSQMKTSELIDELNQIFLPMNTGIRFGVDKDDVFFISVFEIETDKLLRRFPREKGFELLPKVKELIGILFDSHG